MQLSLSPYQCFASHRILTSEETEVVIHERPGGCHRGHPATRNRLGKTRKVTSHLGMVEKPSVQLFNPSFGVWWPNSMTFQFRMVINTIYRVIKKYITI